MVVVSVGKESLVNHQWWWCNAFSIESEYWLNIHVSCLLKEIVAKANHFDDRWVFRITLLLHRGVIWASVWGAPLLMQSNFISSSLSHDRSWYECDDPQGLGRSAVFEDGPDFGKDCTPREPSWPMQSQFYFQHTTNLVPYCKWTALDVINLVWRGLVPS